MKNSTSGIVRSDVGPDGSLYTVNASRDPLRTLSPGICWFETWLSIDFVEIIATDEVYHNKAAMYE